MSKPGSSCPSFSNSKDKEDACRQLRPRPSVGAVGPHHQTRAFTLVVMSVASWYLIAVRALRQFRHAVSMPASRHIWNAPTSTKASAACRELPGSPFEALARQGARRRTSASHTRKRRSAASSSRRVLTRAMRKSLRGRRPQHESGLAVLASIGSDGRPSSGSSARLGPLPRADRHQRLGHGTSTRSPVRSARR